MEETKFNVRPVTNAKTQTKTNVDEQTKTNGDGHMIKVELDKIQQEFERAVDGLIYFAAQVTEHKNKFIETKKRLLDEDQKSN